MANLGIGLGRGSQWGGGYYGYRLKFCIFYGYRLIFFSVSVNSQFKNNLYEKAKQTRERSEICRGETFIITEMAVFTLEKYYSREPCYPLDDSRQIGNTS